MRLKLKEDPKEWRKATLLSAVGLGLLSSVLRWRHVLARAPWVAVLATLAVVMICAWFRPRWFRGYYRVSSRVGFYVSQFLGCVVLAVLFLVVVTPVGWVLRLLGKDVLELKARREAVSCWHKAGDSTPLDRLF
ncbi:conserved hypothetical protein [Verrucomicrobia bacterium]|nr:conserved hypothetical protein [Verrucomicrobiota bacterium]